jgi:hypothetical protein
MRASVARGAGDEQLVLARIVCRVDVVDASWTGELNLENRLLISSPSVVRMFCRIDPQRSRLQHLAVLFAHGWSRQGR